MKLIGKYKNLIIFTAVIILFCFISTAWFTSSSYFHFFDFSTTKAQNIGGTIGGITAPILGIFSSILLYLALTRQIESNKEQHLKNESDIIFLLFNQLDHEIEGFYFKYQQGEKSFIFHGLEGLHEFSKDFRYRYDAFHAAKHGTFSIAVYQSGYLEILIDTFNLIKKRIEISLLSNEMKILFKERATSYYNGKLKIAYLNFAKTIEKYDYLEDDLAEKFKKFVSDNTKFEVQLQSEH